MNKEIEKMAEIGTKLHNCGISVFPKADGRIEIPQFVVSAMDWKGLSEIYFTHEDVGICMYADGSRLKNIIGSSISNTGRFRIPATSIRKTPFFRKGLIFVIERERVVAHPRAELSKVKEDLGVLFSGSKTPKEHLKELEKDLPKLGKPELILLDTNRITTFKPVDLPFSFLATFSSTKREIVFSASKYNNFNFFLVPGIERSGNNYRIGFLLINNQVYKKISSKLKDYSSEHNEIGFWPHPKETGGFQIFINPSFGKYEKAIVGKAKIMCKDPKELLEIHFRQNPPNINDDIYITPPSIIAKQTINVMCPEETINNE